jgi:hypothetical protein
MNTTNIFKLAACLAWAGVAVSSAAPADALALTSQTGDYASCSANYTARTRRWCGDVETGDPGWETLYNQTIKLVSQACNTGGCQGVDTVYTDFVYPAGRKTATAINWCDTGTNVYQLGTCSC